MKRKKVLIISYYWPPCGGIGVLRCLKIAKYLRHFGWEPIVFTAEDAHYPNIDYSNDKDIPDGITILKQKIWEPYHIYKWITGKKKDANVNNVFYTKSEKAGLAHQFSVWIRSNFFIPDARKFWIQPSVKFLLQYLDENPVDAIFSNGPPHSNTRIATLLKQKTGIPFLADFQDPWTQVDYYQLLHLTKWADDKHHRLEQDVFKHADAVSIVSPTWKNDLKEIGAKNVSVIPWGYDQDDFKNIKRQIDEKFTLTHLGIMGYDRNPSVLFKVLKDLIEEVEDFENDVEIKLVGQVDFSVLEAIQLNGIEGILNLVGSVSRSEALQLCCNSNLLLLLLNQQSNALGRIPGKLFEYLAARRPIIVLGAEESDATTIVLESKGGVGANYEDYDKIKKIIIDYYQQYKTGNLQNPVNSHIQQYSNQSLTKKVAALLDSII